MNKTNSETRKEILNIKENQFQAFYDALVEIGIVQEDEKINSNDKEQLFLFINDFFAK